MDKWALPQINLQVCSRCGICIVECPTHAVEMGPDGPVVTKPLECTYCAECEAICPEGAITCTFDIVWGGGNAVALRENQ